MITQLSCFAAGTTGAIVSGGWGAVLGTVGAEAILVGGSIGINKLQELAYDALDIN